MMILKQSTAKKYLFFAADETDGVTGKTGLNTWTVNYSKAGAALASISPTITERSLGYYELAITSTHTDTLGHLLFDIVHAGALIKPLEFDVSAGILDDIGTAVAAVGVSVAAIPTNQGQIIKNVAFSNWKFAVYAADGTPVTGITPLVEISKDGGAFANSTNATSEIDNGTYKLDLTQTECNANVLLFRLSGTGAVTYHVFAITAR